MKLEKYNGADDMLDHIQAMPSDETFIVASYIKDHKSALIKIVKHPELIDELINWLEWVDIDFYEQALVNIEKYYPYLNLAYRCSKRLFDFEQTD